MNATQKTMVPSLVPLLAVVVAALIACSDGATSVEGLLYPRGLAVEQDGSIVVAEVGRGRLLRLQPGRTKFTVLADGLPTSWDGGPGGDSVVGVSGIEPTDDGLYFVVGEFRGDRFRRAFFLPTDGTVPIPITTVDEPLPAEGLVNPYDIAVADSRVFISDAGANAVFLVDEQGDAKLWVRLEDLIIGADQASTMRVDAVPTGLAVGPDGALYLALLSGAPFAPGTAAIVRISTESPARPTPVVTGLTAATDVVFTSTGWLIAAEFSTRMAELSQELTPDRALELPGRITAWCGSESLTLAADVVTPTSIAASGALVFVSEEFAGRVRQLERRSELNRPCGAWGGEPR